MEGGMHIVPENTSVDRGNRLKSTPETEHDKIDETAHTFVTFKNASTLNVNHLHGLSKFKNARPRSCLTRLLCGVVFWEFGREPKHEKSEYAADLYLRQLNLRMTVASFIGIGTMMLHNQWCWDSSSFVFHDSYEECSSAIVLKILNLCGSAITVHQLLKYYYVMSFLKMKEWSSPTRFKAFRSSDLHWKFFIEFVIAVWQPIPGYSHIYGLGHKVIIFMMALRIYLILRLLRDFSPAYSKRFLIGKDYGRENNVKVSKIDTGSVLKTYFYSYTNSTLGAVLFIVVVCFAYVMYILEREYLHPVDPHSGYAVVKGKEILSMDAALRSKVYAASEFQNYSACIWFISVTLTTLGYGDLVPWGKEGRTLAIVTTLTGIMLTSLLVSVLTNKLAPTPFQQYIIDWLQHSEARARTKETAALIIQLAYKRHQLQKRNKSKQKKTAIKKIQPALSKRMTGLGAKIRLCDGLESTKGITSRLNIAREELNSIRILQTQKSQTNGHTTEFQGITRSILKEQFHLNRRINSIEKSVSHMSGQVEMIASLLQQLSLSGNIPIGEKTIPQNLLSNQEQTNPEPNQTQTAESLVHVSNDLGGRINISIADDGRELSGPASAEDADNESHCEP